MVNIRVGDRIKVAQGGGRLGVVRAIWGDYASIEFDVDEPQIHIPIREIEYFNALEREQIEKAAEASLRERQTALELLRSVVRSDFVNAEIRFASEFGHGPLTREDLDAEKADFVKAWVAQQSNLRVPDPEQAKAIACISGNTQVVARAGSGKTTTLVSRAVFLINHCGVAPSEMLLLAFNRKAAREIRRSLLIALVPEAIQSLDSAIAKAQAQTSSRSRQTTGGDLEAAAVESAIERFKSRLPHVMTFHALAHAIVHPEGKLLYDGSDGDSLGLSRVVQEVIDEFIRNPRTQVRIRSLMMAHFREDWERILEGGFHLRKEEQLVLLRSLPRETLAGDYVKSAGEKAIANFLFERGVPYKYERNHWWDGVNYKPDFTIFQTERSGVVIEYYGLAGDAQYDDQIKRKRAYWQTKPHWKLIELFPSDLASGITPKVEEELTAVLLDSGILCARLSDEEIWRNIRARAIDRFTKAASAFIGRCRKKVWDPEEAIRRIRRHNASSPAEEMFLSLGVEVFSAYMDRVTAIGDEDFDGLMQKASDRIIGGFYTFANRSSMGDLRSLRHICIDEFQDFSELFYRLVNSIRSINPNVSFFCVGDDWQAINSFAGSELRFFESFNDYFGVSERRDIPTNYRSANGIVNIGNALMHNKGAPGSAHANRMGRVWTFDLGKFKPSLTELQRYPGDVITPLVGRLAYKFLQDKKAVVLLARRNGLPWYVKGNEENAAANSLDGFLYNIRSMMPEDLRDLVTISTAHKYKGLEKPAVIILDAVARSYPLIHPDWPFYRIFGDDPEKITEDERRLFYVALTRAIDDLVIISDGDNRSPFLTEIADQMSIAHLPIDAFPPVPSKADPRVILTVITSPGRSADGGTYQIKDQLRASRFQYDGVRRLWERSFAVSSFKLNTLQAEPWARAASGVDAVFNDEYGQLLGKYAVDGGDWKSEVDAWHLLGSR